MLTRLTVKGFKNLIDVTVDFGPYTCIAGPNAVGKSNLFDSIEFLALLADHPFLEAAKRLRPSGDRSTDPVTLFTLGKDGRPVRTISIEAEMLIGMSVTDEFGTTAEPRSTFLRYSIELEHVPNDRAIPGRIGGLSLVSESLEPISKGSALSHLAWPHSVRDFRQQAIQNKRFAGAYVSTEDRDDGRVILVHADGGSRGNPRRSPVVGATRSTLSGVFSADEPTMLAARLEMRSWRKLALEPSAMRAPDELFSPAASVSSNGAHIAAALWRLAQEDPDVESLVSANLSELTDVREVTVVADESRETLSLEARLGAGPRFPARSLSEGTLRFLALAVIEADPNFRGLICMEEPENGIHPAKIPAMVDLLRRLAVDPQQTPGTDNPLRQVIVNTHSPEFVRAQEPGDLLIAWSVAFKIGDDEVMGVDFYPMAGSWRSKQGGPQATPFSVASYLNDPRKSPVWQSLQLPIEQLEA
jgi:predicted ATPase